MKTVVVGTILIFGAALIVAGTSLVDSVESSMERTVTSSLAGHLQVYSAEAEDELALFGGPAMSGDDIGEIRDFSKIRKPIEEIDNVEAVIPMGLMTSRVLTPTQLDKVAEQLRTAVKTGDWTTVERLKQQVTSMAEQLNAELRNREQIEGEGTYMESLRDLKTVSQTPFWDERLRKTPEEALQFIDTKIAPLSAEARIIFLRLIGTDPGRFARYFDRFRITEGKAIPDGERGILIGKYIYEHRLKNSVARGFDEIAEAKAEDDMQLDESDTLQSVLSRMRKEYRSLIFGLPPETTNELKSRLKDFLDEPGIDATFRELILEFLKLDDANFSERREFFYSDLDPLTELYEFDVGEQITLKSLDQRGFIRSSNVKVWGIYSFRGLEDLEMAGSMAMLDLVTFRDLYGFMSEDQRQELRTIRAGTQVRPIDREEAESALFGEARPIEETIPAKTGSGVFEEVESKLEASGAGFGLSSTYDPAKLDRGLIRNAAILLKDPARLEETAAKVKRVISENQLGLRVVDWQSASGIVGQLVTVIQLVLYVSIAIIFLVAVVIINNSMLIATVERTGEIGTMRAIGTQRPVVSAIFVCETLILGIVAGLLGAVLGAAVVSILGETGIAATSDVVKFLFSGDYLYPEWDYGHLLTGMGLILVVSLLSTFYPASIASRVPPIVAMRESH
jgi:ABC-type lipoprotein release transport system permease subunit